MNMPTVSRSVGKHGESAALKQVISQAWRYHCLFEGIPESECPMQGLVASDEPDDPV